VKNAVCPSRTFPTSARIDSPLQDNAVHRRTDAGLRKVRLVHAQIRLGNGNLGAGAGETCNGAVIGGFGRIEFLTGNGLFHQQLLLPLEIELVLDNSRLRLFDLGLGRAQGGAGVIELRLELVSVQLRQNIASLHTSVEINHDLANNA
jgi:hypothetical protein